MTMRLNMTMKNSRDVEKPRDPKERKWMPIEDWAQKRGYRWIAFGEEPKERIWIPMEVDDGK